MPTGAPPGGVPAKARPSAGPAAQRRQLDLLARLNAEHRAARIDERLEARIQSFELAYRMQAEAAEAFDISREPKHVQDLYGGGDKDYNDLIFEVSGVSGVPHVVTPEPVTIALLGSGLMGVGGAGLARRRRQQQQAQATPGPTA